MMLMMLWSIIIVIISMIMMNISTFISYKNIYDQEKNSPFECGFNPLSSSRLPFSLQFFLVSIIFLIFDIEIALILPMIFSMYNMNIFFWIITSTLIIIILLLGLYYEWNQGMLEWS
nr:NADH dehydrogenase subunit 3 [Aviostivalius klossi bispiniformis]